VNAESAGTNALTTDITHWRRVSALVRLLM
jgi:hypothetical protein